MIPILGAMLYVVGMTSVCAANVEKLNNKKKSDWTSGFLRLKLEKATEKRKKAELALAKAKEEEEELKNELYAAIQQRDAILKWAETVFETEIDAQLYDQISKLRVRALELSNTLDIELDEFTTLRGAKRTNEQIASLNSRTN
jgi:hypothetical protein